MSVSRYIPVKVAVVDGNIYPISELDFVKDSYFGDYYKLNSSYDRINHLEEMVWDVKKKCYKTPHVVEIKQLDTCFGVYNIGETILVEMGNRKISNKKLVDIIYEEYESSFRKFKKVEEYYKQYFSEEDLKTFIPEDIIELRVFKATYVFEDGHKTNYPHQFYRIEE